MLIVGLDWSCANHAFVFMDEQGAILERGTVLHTGQGLCDLDDRIRRWADRPEQVRVGLENHDGPLPQWLAERGYIVFGIQPKSAERARDMFRPSGSKDDRIDALVLAEFVRLNADRLHPLRRESPRTEQLRDLMRRRAALVNERSAQVSRLRALLDQWSPQLSGLCNDLTRRRWQRELLQWFPTERDLTAAHGNTVRAFARRNHVRRRSFERVERLRASAPMPLPEHRAQTVRRQVRSLVEQVQRLTEQVDELERQMAQLIEQHPDAEVFRSLPTANTVTLAALLSIFGEDRQRPRSWRAIAARCGVAPITKASGKTCSVRRRRACDHTYQQALILFAFNTVFADGCWAGPYYRRKRADGAGHYAALRCLAQRWVKILHRLWRDRTAYDEQFHQEQQTMRQKRAA